MNNKIMAYLIAPAIFLGALLVPAPAANAGWFDTARCGVLNGELVAAKATAAGLDRLTPAVLAKQVATATAAISKAELEIATKSKGIESLDPTTRKTVDNRITALKAQIVKDKFVIAAAKRVPGDRKRAHDVISSTQKQLKKYKC